MSQNENEWKVEIPFRMDGPRISIEAWRVYSFIVSYLRQANRTTLWIPDAIVVRAAKIQCKDFPKIVPELKANGYLCMKQSRAGCEYSLPSGQND